MLEAMKMATALFRRLTASGIHALWYLAHITIEVRHHAPQPSEGFDALVDVEEIEPLCPLKFRLAPLFVFWTRLWEGRRSQVVDISAVDRQLEHGDVVVE